MCSSVVYGNSSQAEQTPTSPSPGPGNSRPGSRREARCCTHPNSPPAHSPNLPHPVLSSCPTRAGAPPSRACFRTTSRRRRFHSPTNRPSQKRETASCDKGIDPAASAHCGSCSPIPDIASQVPSRSGRIRTRRLSRRGSRARSDV